MKVRYTGDYYKVRFTKGEIYDVTIDPESGWYQITDETGDEGFVPAGEDFEIVE